MHQRRVVLAGLMTTPLLGCSTMEPQAREMINDAVRGFYEALARRDVHLMQQSWRNDEHVLIVHLDGRGVSVGWDAVRAGFERFFASFPEITISMTPSHMRVTGEVAVVMGLEQFAARRRDGTALRLEAMATQVYERASGRWLAVYHQARRLA